MKEKKENVCRRNNEELKKVIDEQAKGFKKVHKILQDKTNLICEFRKEIVELKGKIKELEIENRRLKHDKK